MYIVLDSMYETMSISTGLYPNLDLWNANKLHYMTLTSQLMGIFHYYKLFILNVQRTNDFDTKNSSITANIFLRHYLTVEGPII